MANVPGTPGPLPLDAKMLFWETEVEFLAKADVRTLEQEGKVRKLFAIIWELSERDGLRVAVWRNPLGQIVWVW